MKERISKAHSANFMADSAISRFKKNTNSYAGLSELVYPGDHRNRVIVLDLVHDGSLPDYTHYLDSSIYEVKFTDTIKQAYDIADNDAIVSLVHIPRDTTAWVDKVIEFHDAAPHIRQIAMLTDPIEQAPAVSKLSRTGTLYDFHQLPLDATRFLHTVGHIRGLACLEHIFREKPDAIPSGEPYMVGDSAAMKDVFTAIRRFASAEAPVLITGESGTGKELAARAIHERSQRADAPFIVINCAALPATLIESELFGYEKGAFTGATQRKPGRLELANGGTLFLDEMGDLPPEVQAHFLRFLQEGTIERLGGTKTIELDVRIVAATHVDLETAVAEDRFREDLYYRLNVLRLNLPPLRKREKDVELLARFFLRTFAGEYGKSGLRFSRNALLAIRRYGWPGNIRELISAVRRAVVMTNGHLIREQDLGIDYVNDSAALELPTLSEARRATEFNLINKALFVNRNNVLKASKEIGISRVSFYRLMKKHGISPPPD